MTYQNIHSSACADDEALWAAYRRDDKAVVMDYLFRRNLVGSEKSPAAECANGELVLINRGPR